MESVLVVIALIALIGGTIGLLSRQGLLPWTLPALRVTSGEPEPVRDSDDGPSLAPGPITEPKPLTPMIPARASAARTQTAKPGTAVEPVRLDLVPAASDIPSVRLERIEDRLDELQRAMEGQSDLVSEAMRRLHAEIGLRAEAEEARRDVAQERLRADILALVSRFTPERQPGASPRRMEVSAELYAQLARLEAALATVTNPILLPGEPYAPPAELPPESLVWENWNEVGERAFALADSYSAQRLHLSAQTRADVGAFVTTLRTLLTRSVYPNLQGEADLAHQDALHAALDEIAAELPRVRDLLETEYLEGRVG